MFNPGVSLSWLLLFFAFMPGYSQLPLTNGDVRSKGMSQARIMLADEWSAMNNPAGLAALKANAFSIACENHFRMPELFTGSFSYGGTMGKTGFGAAYTSSGYSVFRQNHALIGIGMHFTPSIRAGAGFHYILIRQPKEYGTVSAWIPSMGLQFCHKNLTLGIQVFNPARQKLRPSGIHAETIVSLGLGIYMGDSFYICTETEKRSGQKADLCIGIESSLQKIIFIRFGISSGTLQKFSVGVGYKKGNINIDAAVTKHPVLEYNTALSVSFLMGQHRKKNLSNNRP